MKQKNHFLCLEHCSGTRNTKGDLGSLAWKIFAAQPQVGTPAISSAHFTGDSLREAEWAAWHHKELWGRGINRPLRPQETQLYLSSRTAQIHFKAALGLSKKENIPGFLGTPAGITTTSQPFRHSGNCSGPMKPEMEDSQALCFWQLLNSWHFEVQNHAQRHPSPFFNLTFNSDLMLKRKEKQLWMDPICCFILVSKLTEWEWWESHIHLFSKLPVPPAMCIYSPKALALQSVPPKNCRQAHSCKMSPFGDLQIKERWAG